MKSIVLLIGFLLLVSVVFSQQRINYTKVQKEKVIKLSRPDLKNEEGFFPERVHSSVLSENKSGIDEQQIGTTFYDLQTNSSMSGKITVWDDCSMAAVWTLGFNWPEFPERGTGYNYYYSGNWESSPTSRIESVRTGYPSHTDYLANSEIIVAHNAVDALVFNYRPTKGTGNWTSFTFQGPEPDWHELLWAKIVTSGPVNSIIHLLASTTPSSNNGQPYNGMDPALLYSRSIDGGLSWTPENIQLPGITSAKYLKVPAESYVWAEPVGNTIAFMVSDTWQSDMYIMKSDDNGNTWTKTIIWQHPYPFFDWDVDFTDTLWAPDGSHDIAIGPDGMVHCVAGICRILFYEGALTIHQWPYGEGIAYWNEDRPPFEAPNGNPHDALDSWNVLVEDYNLIGWSPDVDGNGYLNLLDEIFIYDQYLGLSTMPSLMVNENNTVIFLYSTTTETYDNGTNNFKHIWLRYELGSAWSEPIEVSDELIYMFSECIFPAMPKKLFCSSWYFTFINDDTPGLAISGDHSYVENRINACFAPWGVGMDEQGKSDKASEVSDVIYLPEEKQYFVFIDLNSKTTISYELYNVNWQKVGFIHSRTLNKGRHKLVIDLAGLKHGIYLCSIEAGNKKIVRKVMK